MPDIQSRATIIEMHPYSSYTLRTDSGCVIRRNSRALRPLFPELHHQQHQDNSIFDNSTLRMRIRDVPAPMPAPIPPPSACAPGQKVLRTGRVIRAPLETGIVGLPCLICRF